MKKSTIPLVYGVFVALGLIGYFLLVSLFGVHNNPLFSLLNPVIVGIGIYSAITKYRAEKGPKFKFQKGLSTGFITGAVATILFTGFFAIYATELNPGYLEELITMWESDWFVGIGMVVAMVGLMGFVTTFVLTFAFMQLLKDSWNTKEGKKHSF